MADLGGFATLLCALGLFCPPADGGVLRTLDFQTRTLLGSNDRPRQWDNYVPDSKRSSRFGTSGISLGSPGKLPYPFTQAARFQPQLGFGRPRSMAVLGRDTSTDSGVPMRGPVDAAQGLERYYSWFTYFPRDFKIPRSAKDAATVFQAWHGDSRERVCKESVLMFAQRSTPRAKVHLFMRVVGGRYAFERPSWDYEGVTDTGCYAETWKTVDLGPLTRGRWIRWSMHAKWDTDPSEGLIEIQRDRERHVVHGATLYQLLSGVPDHAHMEQGIYMPQEPTSSARERSLWQVGFKIATSAKDVAAPKTCRRLALAGSSLGLFLSRRSTSSKAPTLRLPTRKRMSARIDGRGIRFKTNKHGRVSLPAGAFDRKGVHRISVRPRGSGRRYSLRVRSRGC